MGAHAINAFRTTNTSFRFGVSAIIFLLIALACIVPGAVTGIVVTAIDFLLNDHVPSSIKSCAYAAVVAVKQQLLFGGSVETASLMLALQFVRLSGGTWNTSMCASTTSSTSSDCPSTLNNSTYVADALNGMTDRAPPSVRAALSIVLNNSVGSNASVSATYWQRSSARNVVLTPLATFSANGWLPGAPHHDASSDNSTSLSVNMSTASRFLAALDPYDGSMRWLFPMSQPALAQSSAVLLNGLYMDVRIAGRCVSNQTTVNPPLNNRSSIARSCSGVSSTPPVYASTLWSRVFAGSTIQVRPLLTSSTLYFGPSTIGLFDTATRQLTACAETASEGPPSVTAASIGVPLLPEEVSASIVQSTVPALSNLAGCQAVFRFLSARALDNVNPESNVLLSSTSSAHYIASYPVATHSTSALTPHEHAMQSYVVVVVVPRGSTEGNIVRARGQIAVVAFVVAAVTVFMLVITIRLMTQPLPAITRAIDACATLQLHRIEMMEASMIVEISEIQKSLAYLAIRLHHYIKFIPDRKVIDGIARLPSDDDDEDESSDDDKGSSGGSSDNDGSIDRVEDPSAACTSSPSSKKAHHRATHHEDDEFSLEEKLADQRRVKPPKAPLHSVMVDVLYESRHLNRNTLHRKKLPSKSARFVFRHRVTDPVLSMLTRQCREHLNERPGETLVVFAGRRDGGSGAEYGMRQLCTDEDVLFAFEAFKTQRPAVDASPGGGAMPLPVVTLCVRKGSAKSVLPVLIAIGTLLTVVSRFVLSVQRLASSETNTQLLGLLLLGCLGVQVAQNALISLYLVRRFRVIDRDFRAWAEVSRNEITVGVVFGSLNVTNLEIMGCHVRLSHNLRLSAPISSRLRVKISMYSFVGFIVGDLLPFVFILINTILQEQYRDPYVVIPVVFSVLSVSSILVSHGIMRFVVVETLASKSSASLASPSGAKGGAGAAAGSPVLGRSLLLTRKSMTVLHLRITKEASFLDRLSISLVDVLLDRLYDAVQTSVKQSGGLLLEARGLSLVIVWNAHAVVPHHIRVAYHVFLKLREDIERNILPQFFGLEKLRSHVAASLAPSARRHPAEITKAVFSMHGKHRLVGSLVSGEMAMGYVGTLTAQTFQRVGYHGPLCDAICKLNEVYGSTLLTTGESLQALQQMESNCVSRKIDAILLSSEFVAPANDAGLLAPYVAEVASTASSSARTTPMVVHADTMLPFAPPDAQPIEVHELVVHAFLSLPDACGVSGGGAASVAPMTFTHQQLRRRPRTLKTVEAIRLYTDAMEIWHAFSNDAPLNQYVEQFPDDVVARAVRRWEVFVPAPNRSDAIQFPRLLTSLGLSRHPCETEKGATLAPAQAVSEAERAMEDYHERVTQRNRLLRPPRSERRVKQQYEDAVKRGGGVATGLGGTSNEVIEQVLAADDNLFTVTFQSATSSLEERPNR